ncbi:TetR/AcrR family transcriptional regulator [Actinoplanes palleronii]|uniref:Transcriptional regulator, TetR family protein n=1 Tax=Actinoplanes palleronii TaxID=113570 RepID=A0ABQ4BBS1_9ACTN|nr:TetR/AcrR family transcriptional regulator C-terminal domain-containing protein [Actinoplanes palleronii]GIE68040.1 putative transcriptional regulator, TetR family protein [Actinoplanes palleronii]
MTKSQGDVVRAALAVLNEQGAAAVSMRAVADHLGVRMNTVVWHVKSRARLGDLMADAIIGGVALDDLPAGWRERAAEIIRRYRSALLAHRDGASVVAGTFAAEPATLDVAEALVGALLDGGLPERKAAWTCWSLVYFTLGLTQEEQSAPSRFTRDLTVGDRPALLRALPHLASEAFSERFEHGLTRLLTSP